MKKTQYIITLYATLASLTGMQANAQTSNLLHSYRQQVAAYNHDIKAAAYSIKFHEENTASAKADFKPKLTGNADMKYTGNPLRLNVTLPPYNESYTINGRHTQYGATLTVSQPIYTGGLLKASYNKALSESENAILEKARIANDLTYQTDQIYWTYVATREMADIARKHRDATAALADAIRQRVSNGYTGRSDLLTAEVRLNDAEYQLQRALNDAESARLALNSLAGVNATERIPTDTILNPDTTKSLISGNIRNRPEMAIAYKQIDIKRHTAHIADAAYKPNISIGISGNFSSPGYDFRAAPDPNYCIYATLSIPIFEWGKKGNTHRMGKHATALAEEQMKSTTDKLRLEAETAQCDYARACEQVKLTASSLQKAKENQFLITDKYYKGNVSITEVINAQIYYLDACKNHIRSKLDACIAKSSLEYAYGYWK